MAANNPFQEEKAQAQARFDHEKQEINSKLAAIKAARDQLAQLLLLQRKLDVSALTQGINDLEQQLFWQEKELNEWIRENEAYVALKTRNPELANLTYTQYTTAPDFRTILIVKAREMPVPVPEPEYAGQSLGKLVPSPYSVPIHYHEPNCKGCILKGSITDMITMMSAPPRGYKGCGHELDHYDINELMVYFQSISAIRRGTTIEQRLAQIAKHMAKQLLQPPRAY